MSYGGLSHQTNTHIGDAIVAFSEYSSNYRDALISSTIFLNKFFELALTTSNFKKLNKRKLISFCFLVSK